MRDEEVSCERTFSTRWAACSFILRPAHDEHRRALHENGTTRGPRQDVSAGRGGAAPGQEAPGQVAAVHHRSELALDEARQARVGAGARRPLEEVVEVFAEQPNEH